MVFQFLAEQLDGAAQFYTLPLALNKSVSQVCKNVTNSAYLSFRRWEIYNQECINLYKL